MTFEKKYEPVFGKLPVTELKEIFNDHRKKTVLHTVSSLSSSSGGPARTVTGLTDHLSRIKLWDIKLLYQDTPGEVNFQASMDSLVDREIVTANPWPFSKLALPFRNKLTYLINTNKPPLLHDHGLWLLNNHYAAEAARKFQIPLLLHPRGMLEPWALEYKQIKKTLALKLYQSLDLNTVNLFFATSQQEAENIRRLCFKQPIAIIPNGVNAIDFEIKSNNKKIENKERIILFLSRIHPKKGLINLIEVFNNIRPNGWKLIIAGPDENSHLEKILNIVKLKGLDKLVSYHGIVEGEEKNKLFNNADLFVLPSYSENFGVVVAEALACGLPVITTHGTPWSGLVSHGCGWWIEPTVDALTDALNQATTMEKKELQAMGEKGREFSKCFNWVSIAEQTSQVYQWVLGQTSKPEFVLID